MKVPKRGMPKPFAGIRAHGRGKGHRRPWTVICAPSAFICIVFLVSSRQTMAKPMQILRLGADQMQEILKYIHAQEKGDNGGQKGEKEEPPILFELKANEEPKWNGPSKIEESSISPLESEEGECQRMDQEEQDSLQLRIRHFLHSQLQHIWSDQFGVQVLGMNVTVHSIRTHAIRPPHLQIEAICSSNGQNRVVASLSGGSLTIRANYRSIYRTIRTGNLRIRIGHFQGKLRGNGCSGAGVDRLDVQFGPRLLEEVDEAVANHLRERARHLICSRIQQFVGQNYRRR